jgi:hypothetical protein
VGDAPAFNIEHFNLVFPAALRRLVKIEQREGTFRD